VFRELQAATRVERSRCFLERDLGLDRLRPRSCLRLGLDEGGGDRRSRERQAAQREEGNLEPVNVSAELLKAGTA
jgi:hypothetical protein